MPATAASHVAIAPNVLLDGRLALFHETETVAGGGRFALRLRAEPAGGRPADAALGHDFDRGAADGVDRGISAAPADHRGRSGPRPGFRPPPRRSCSARLRERCEVIALAGNHDRHVAHAIEFEPRWETPEFVFQHGHCEPEETGPDPDHRASSSGGESSPTAPGLRLKFPAFVQQETALPLDSARLFTLGRRRRLGGRRRRAGSGSALRAASCGLTITAPPPNRRAPARSCNAGSALALIGIAIVQAGQSFTSAGASGAGFFSLVHRAHHQENAERDDEEIDQQGDEIAVVPGHRLVGRGAAREWRNSSRRWRQL